MTDDVLFLSGAQVARLDDSVVFAYVSLLSADSGAVAKSGSVDPGNATAGRPTVHATGVGLGVQDAAAARAVAWAAQGESA
ncbi:hypothetical protein [Streptomyces griseorubiginosus]|uniref:hypothetical protein n=1 Tax=Streptomyces griseorubiginosus TaxID=67304 RepID=UPI0036E81C48